MVLGHVGCALMSVLSPRYQPNGQCGECRDDDDVREKSYPRLKLRNGKINPLSVLQTKENNGYRKTCDAVTRAKVILEVECAPDAERNANCRKSAERRPPSGADMLAMQTTNERNKRPTAQREKDDDAQNECNPMPGGDLD